MNKNSFPSGFDDDTQRTSPVDNATDISSPAGSAPPMYFSPEQIQQFFQIAPFAVAVFDKDLNYMAASRQWKQDYGIEDVNVIGKNQFDLFPMMPDDVKEQYRRCLKGESFENQVSAFESPSGSTEWLKWTLQPWMIEKDVVGGVILFTEFISEQQKREEELKQSKTFLQAVLESVQDGIIACNASGEINLLNKASQELLGSSELRIADKIEGKGYDLFRPDGKTLIGIEDRPMVRALRGEVVLGDEIILSKKGRPTRRFLAHGRPMVDADGNKLGAVVSIHDITEEARVTRQLRDREERYRILYNKTPIMLHSVDQNGKLMRVSDYWLEKLGYERDEVIGQQFYDFLPDESKTIVRDKVLPEFVKSGRAENIEIKVQKKNGAIIDTQLSAVAEYNDDGTLRNSLTVLTDITERKETEAQLLQAQKLEAVGQLTGGLAHDFNNLLGVILLSLQMLERIHGDEDQSMSRIKLGLDATLKGAELIKRLRAFSRRQTLEQSVTDVNSLIEGMRGLLTRTIGGSNTIVTHYDRDLEKIEIDQNQLESCLLNMAINARDAMPDGGKLFIEAKNVVFDDIHPGTISEIQPGSYVLISVSDNGTGIPEEMLDQVFQPFFTTKDSGQGTGLGLSMVYGFVKQSNGHIDIRSEQGVGTTIELYLPALDGVSDVDANQDARDAIRVVGGSETILLVDDDKEVRDSTRLMLEGLGYGVIVASDGPSAVSILKSDASIDLLFSDIVMPGGLDGIALSNESRKLRPDVKVLLTTGYAEAAMNGGREPATETEIIDKPYFIKEVAQMIRELLD